MDPIDPHAPQRSSFHPGSGFDGADHGPAESSCRGALLVLVACAWLSGQAVLASATKVGGTKAAEVLVDEDLLHGLQFRQVGPFRGGRSTTVTGHKDLPFTFLMGTSGGGVWKTTNAGGSWQNISDGFINTGSIGAVEFAPSDRNVLYVGTGSGCPRGNVINGDGVYRSEDGGDSWKHVGLSKAGLVPRIVVHPKDPEIVYAAVLGNIFRPNQERGVYRSRNGGETWQRVHFVSEHTGAVDIAINPLNPRVLYAAMWTAERKPWTLVDGSEEGGLWKSVDGGDTWTKLEQGLPSGPVGRIGIALSPSRPERIWVHFTAPHGKGGVFRSDDAGDSWTLVNGERKLQVRGWYYSHLEAHPTDPDTVFSLGLRFFQSIDGGRTFERRSTPHGDNHDLWIHPAQPEVMVEANDGGGTVTLDGGKTWSTLHNQPTAEFYRLTVDDGFPYRLYGAQQDNTSISVPAWSEGGFSQEQDWWRAGGGESGHIAVHKDRPDIVYSGNYIGLLERWDRSTGERKGVLLYPELADGVPPRDLRYRFQWNAPIRLSPHSADVLYHTSHQVHRSKDEGSTWETLTGDLSYDDEEKQELPGGPIQIDDTGVEVYSTVFAFEESPRVQGELWAGTDDGRVHLSRDDGRTWQEVTPEGMEEDTTVNTIELSSASASRAYVVGHRYRLGDDRPLIWRTQNYGKTWKLLSEGNGIPPGHSVRVVREHPARPEFLVAGTERGLYMSLNSGEQWQPLQLNLPVVQISDLAFVRGGLAVATHGRSFWVLDDLTPLVQLSEDVLQSDMHLFDPMPTYLVGGGGYSQGAQPDGRAPGAQLFVWLAERGDEEGADAEGSVDSDEHARHGTLTVLNGQGEVVRTTALVVGGKLNEEDQADGVVLEPGLNQLSWDFFGERPKTLENAVMSLGYTGPNRMPPGEYEIRVELEGVASELHAVGDGSSKAATRKKGEAQTALASTGALGTDTMKVLSTRLQVRPDPRLGPGLRKERSPEGRALQDSQVEGSYPTNGQATNSQPINSQEVSSQETNRELGDDQGALAGYRLAEQAKTALVEIHATVASLRSIREQLSALQERLGIAVELAKQDQAEPAQDTVLANLLLTIKERATPLLEEMTEVEDLLMQTKSEAPQDGLNFPPKLDNQYAFLYGQLVGLVSRPNQGAYQRLDDLNAQWRPLAQRWRSLVQGPVEEINKLVREANLGVLMAP